MVERAWFRLLSFGVVLNPVNWLRKEPLAFASLGDTKSPNLPVNKSVIVDFLGHANYPACNNVDVDMMQSGLHRFCAVWNPTSLSWFLQPMKAESQRESILAKNNYFPHNTPFPPHSSVPRAKDS